MGRSGGDRCAKLNLAKCFSGVIKFPWKLGKLTRWANNSEFTLTSAPSAADSVWAGFRHEKHPETSDTSSPLLSWDIAYSLAYYLLSTPTRSVTSTVSPASSGPTAPRIGGGDVVTGRRRVAGGVQDGFMIHWHPGILQVQQSSLSHQVQDWFS